MLLPGVVCVNVLFMVVLLKKKVEGTALKCQATYRGSLQVQPVFLMWSGKVMAWKLKWWWLTISRKETNYNAARKFSVAEANVWRWKEQKQKVINANSTRKSCSCPQHGCYQELEKEIVEFLHLRRKLECWLCAKQKIKCRNLPDHTSCCYIERAAGVSACVWHWGTGLIFVEELCFSRNCQQTLRRSLLLSSDMWLYLKQEQLPPEPNRKTQ